MSDRFPYDLPSREALCVEIRKISRYKYIEDNLVTFEDMYFSPTRQMPGRTFIEMVDLKTNIKSWFVYRRLDVNIALGSSPIIVLTGDITPKAIVEEINRSRNMHFKEDDFDMSLEKILPTENEYIYTLKTLSGSYAYYGKVDVTIRTTKVPLNVRLLEDGSTRFLESGDYRTLE